MDKILVIGSYNVGLTVFGQWVIADPAGARFFSATPAFRLTMF